MAFTASLRQLAAYVLKSPVAVSREQQKEKKKRGIMGKKKTQTLKSALRGKRKRKSGTQIRH